MSNSQNGDYLLFKQRYLVRVSNANFDSFIIEGLKVPPTLILRGYVNNADFEPITLEEFAYRQFASEIDLNSTFNTRLAPPEPDSFDYGFDEEFMRYQCSRCGELFNTYNRVINHERLVHGYFRELQ